MKRALLGLLAVAMTCVTVVPAAAAELPTVPCDRVTGPTAADAATGQQLNRLLSKTMDGHMGAYETSCARIIVQTVKARGLPERAAVLAITTAIVESNLRNVDGGDRDSVGLFQQRDGWGTRADRLKAEVSTGKFLNALLDTPSWSTRPIGEVCQAVQRSAYPDRYALQVSDAHIIVDALWDLSAAAERTGLTAISRQFPDLDVFAKSDDGSFLHKHFDGEKWTGGWANLQGRFKSNPAAYSSGPGRIELLGVGLDGELWQNTWTSAGWSGWKDTGGGTVQWTPAVTSRGGNTLDVFAVNSDERVVHRHFNGSAWGQWTSIGGTASAPPAAIALGPDRINVLVRDADGTLATNMWTRTHGGWWGWRDRGHDISGAPSVSARSTQLMDVFVRDGAKTLQHIVSTNGGTDYSAAQELGPTTLTTPPTSVSMYDKRIDVFSRAANGHLYQRIWSDLNTGTPSGWYNWVDLGVIE